MARARGSDAVMSGVIESDYGVTPAAGFYKLPFVSSAVGDEQGLVEDDTLGDGREAGDPSPDVINNSGDIVVPACVRNLGFWFKCLFGDPVTEQGIAAEGKITFSAQPATGSSIDVDGKTFTFGTDIAIGSTLKATVGNAVAALAASADVGVSAATYRVSAKGNAIEITFDALGVAGNAFTLAVSTDPVTNATVSGATLTGGAATGAYRHVFKSGASILNSASIEIGLPAVPTYAMNYGLGVDTLSFDMGRSGNLNFTLGCIARGEADRTKVSTAGTLKVLEKKRLTQFSGSVLSEGVPVGDIVSSSYKFSNNLDKIEVVAEDGRITGVDPGKVTVTGQDVMRFSDTTLLEKASSGTPIQQERRWKISSTMQLILVNHRVFLPKAKVPVTGPDGVQITLAWQSAKDSTEGCMVTATLINDVESY